MLNAWLGHETQPDRVRHRLALVPEVDADWLLAEVEHRVVAKLTAPPSREELKRRIRAAAVASKELPDLDEVLQ